MTMETTALITFGEYIQRLRDKQAVPPLYVVDIMRPRLDTFEDVTIYSEEGGLRLGLDILHGLNVHLFHTNDSHFWGKCMTSPIGIRMVVAGFDKEAVLKDAFERASKEYRDFESYLISFRQAHNL